MKKDPRQRNPIIARMTLSPSQQAALLAAAEQKIHRRGSTNGSGHTQASFPGATIRALLLKDYLADDDLGSYVIAPQGRAALASGLGTNLQDAE